MKFIRLFFMCLSVTFSTFFASAQGSDERVLVESRYQALKTKVPGDAKLFFERMESCHHLSGEEVYDQDRKTEIESLLAKDKCEKLVSDEIKLLKKYKRNSSFKEALSKSRILFQ